MFAERLCQDSAFADGGIFAAFAFSDGLGGDA